MNTVSKILLFAVASLMFMSAAVADITTEHKVVIQVSSANAQLQAMALNNAVNLQKYYGPGEITIEIVAFGPGLSILTKSKKNKQAERVTSLAKSDIIFSACGTTMEKITRRSGKKPVLLDGVKVVPAGVARIVWLQEKGYSYIRP